jgi:hypothetical protein
MRKRLKVKVRQNLKRCKESKCGAKRKKNDDGVLERNEDM